MKNITELRAAASAKAGQMMTSLKELQIKLKNGKWHLPDFRSMTKEQLKQFGTCGVSLVAVLALTVFASVDLASNGLKGVATTEAAPQQSYASVFGEFYDVSGIDPNEVCTININGQKVVYMANAAQAQAVLDGIIGKYTGDGSMVTSAQFAEDVQIQPAEDYITADMAAKNKKVTETYICQVDEAINYILNGTSEAKTYTVQGGDTLWDIAIASNISVSELAAMNPQLNIERIAIGDVINLYEKHPFVNVNTVEQATEVVTIPFTTSYTQTADLYKGQSKVTSAGANGSKERVVEYVRQNGIIVGTTLISETVTAEPVTQYALVGTTTMPIKTGSGSLISPLGTTQLSSSAGQFGASRGSRRHLGVDLKGNCGDPIYAADAGTVIYAQYSGTYGNVIKINHGNGIETRYAHCNSMSVSYGDNVEKGQQIGTVGKTGNATGYLCHFEVRINGTAVNPFNYI